MDSLSFKAKGLWVQLEKISRNALIALKALKKVFGLNFLGVFACRHRVSTGQKYYLDGSMWSVSGDCDMVPRVKFNPTSVKGRRSNVGQSRTQVISELQIRV